MYLPVIEPIDRICREAIEYGMSGDIPSARRSIDRVRTMRAWLARSVSSHRAESIDVWIENSGIEQSEVHLYRSQIAKLNANLEVIRTWVSGSVSAFTLEELCSSSEGLSLYLDHHLPEVWDFSQDVVVLHGENRKPLFEDLRLRGQKNFVVIVTAEENSAEQIFFGSSGEQIAEDTGGVNIVSFPTESSPRTDIFAGLVGEEIPSLVLIGTDSDPIADNDFQRIFKSLSAVLLGKKSVKEWPRIFTEQWLSRIPALAEHRSVTALKAAFKGQDILIASPGPSLYDSLVDLKARRDRFLLIAPIRSLLALLNSDIVPDFAFHVDATDFSQIIPEHPMMSRVALICTDYAHASVFEGGFKSIYTVPDPAMVGNAISEAFHGPAAPVLQGGCVATCAVGFAAQFKARSITLIGQDLSLSRGNYVEQAETQASPAELESEGEDPDDYLTCEGINGERLRTKEDYYWFIGEMENAARAFSHNIDFINSTSHGAFLKGWLHKTLDLHPLLVKRSTNVDSPRFTSESISETERAERRASLVSGVKAEQSYAEEAAELCAELVKELRSLIETGSNDVTQLEFLESKLQPLLNKPGSILHFYTSRFSMALAAASKSVESLEENLNISAEYYHHIGPRANKLASMLAEASKGLRQQADLSAIENGG